MQYSTTEVKLQLEFYSHPITLYPLFFVIYAPSMQAGWFLGAIQIGSELGRALAYPFIHIHTP